MPFPARPERAVQTDGRSVLVWRLDAPVRAIATTVLGGGIGEREWIVNAEVAPDFHQRDPSAHVASIAGEQRLTGSSGIGFLTAANVLDVASTQSGGVTCDATVGISAPSWACAPDGEWSPWTPGTINLVCWVPAPLSDAALANAVVTATEAKAQALLEVKVPGTGTASDAVAICCPVGGSELYGGPRSPWGAPLARAVHAAVTEGTLRFLARDLAP